MNYIVINTETGEYGIMHSRGKVEAATGARVKANTLRQMFTVDKKTRPIKKSLIEKEIIILPVPTDGKDKLYVDEQLKGKIALNQ